jgi:cellulose synthase/poly-beta-1,6-N-acetylglucosamine synthase-like glycosyltransferase
MKQKLSPLEATTSIGSAIAALLSIHAWVNSRLLRKPSEKPPLVTEMVTVCIPARNEESNIIPCLRAILATENIASLEVLVFDDASSDATSEVAHDHGAADPRVRIIHGDGLIPVGWIGKPHATEQLRTHARGSVVVFVDADVRLEPHAIAAAIAILRVNRFAMVSPYPKQLAVSVSERIVQPLLQWLWMTFLPLRIAERKRPISMVAANGQFMVIDSDALRSIGGFGAVRDQVLDDVALGRALKKAGHRVAVIDGTQLATCRMYNSWKPLRDGYAKNLWSASSNEFGAVAFAVFVSLAYGIPPLAFVFGLKAKRQKLAIIGLFGYLAGVAGRIVSARTTGGRLRDSFLHPISIATLLVLLRRSWALKRRGLLSWKGRSTDATVLATHGDVVEGTHLAASPLAKSA